MRNENSPLFYVVMKCRQAKRKFFEIVRSGRSGSVVVGGKRIRVLTTRDYM